LPSTFIRLRGSPLAEVSSLGVIYSTAGSRSEYRLTDKGRALFPAYTALMQWGNEWTGLPAPPVELLHKPCGHRTTPRVVCSHCGEQIDAHDTEPVVGKGLFVNARR
jgi:hypothetical protein